MKIRLIAFTEAGLRQAHRLGACLPQDAQVEVFRGFGPDKESLAAWTSEGFSEADALVFVGAAGIAVRAIAPHASSKAVDPAVVVVDEAARWVIPLLSGHLGGANRLARLLAEGVGAQAVLTTATDVRGVWAVDDWAAARGMAVLDPSRIKGVSSRLLAGGRVALACDLPLAGQVPEGVDAIELAMPPSVDAAESAQDGGEGTRFDIVLSPFSRSCAEGALRVVPRRIVVGVGCRRGTDEGDLARAIDEALSRAGVYPQAVREVRSIDLKQDEAGLLSLARRRGWSSRFFSADELRAVEGVFASSAFVERTTGVDNVCERAAAACGETVLLPKTVFEGVTVAVALDGSPINWNEE